MQRSEAIVAADTQRHLGRENCNSRHIELIAKKLKSWGHEGSIVIGDFFGQDLNIWNSVKQQQ